MKKESKLLFTSFQLERAWSSLKWKEKLSLVSSVISGITSSDLSNKALEVCHSNLYGHLEIKLVIPTSDFAF